MFNRISYIVATWLMSLILLACGSIKSAGTPTSTLLLLTTTSTPTSTPTIIIPTAAPQLKSPYLGQEPPGTEPKIFAPGIVSHPDFIEYSGAFSPDGSEYYFFRFSDNSQSRLLFRKVVDGKWTEPEELAFSAGNGAFEPYVTFDNQRLYFNWDHPVPAGHPRGLPANRAVSPIRI